VDMPKNFSQVLSKLIRQRILSDFIKVDMPKNLVKFYQIGYAKEF
jgi:hypothetical protein